MGPNNEGVNLSGNEQPGPLSNGGKSSRMSFLLSKKEDFVARETPNCSDHIQALEWNFVGMFRSKTQVWENNHLHWAEIKTEGSLVPEQDRLLGKGQPFQRNAWRPMDTKKYTLPIRSSKKVSQIGPKGGFRRTESTRFRSHGATGGGSGGLTLKKSFYKRSGQDCEPKFLALNR